MLNQFPEELLGSPIRLTHLTFDIDKLPVTILEEEPLNILFLLLDMLALGLQFLSLKLEGERLPIELATILDELTTNYRCVIQLDLKLNYADVTHRITNNFILGRPAVSKCIKNLHLCFTEDYGPNFGNQYMKALSDFFPKQGVVEQIPGAGTVVTFENLSSLCIEIEKMTCANMVWLNFNNNIDAFSSGFPNLTELKCIEGPMTKKKVKGSSKGVIYNGHIKQIMKCFKKLETLVIWCGMRQVKDNTFMWKDNGQAYKSTCTPVCIGDFLPNLQKVSLRGIGERVTDKALEGFYKLKYLRELEIVGQHKITPSGKQNLINAVTSLPCRNSTLINKSVT